MPPKARAKRPVRVQDVARVAGVSPITVSRALSTPDKVRPETRALVNEAVAKTGYVVNRHASTLRSGRSSIISVFVSNLANPHFANAIQGCQDAFEGSSFRLLMAQTGYSRTLQDEVVAEVLPFRPAGAIFTGLVQSERTREALAGLAIPVVETWDHRPDPIDMLVGFSNAKGGELMGEHFAVRGFERIAYVGRVVDRGGQRLAGFRRGLATVDRDVTHVLPVTEMMTARQGMEALDTLLALKPACDAVLFSSDVLAAGAMLRSRQIGLEIPRDIAMAGYGDLDFSAHMAVPLTTVRVDGYEMGRAAGTMLRARLEGRDPVPRIVMLPVSLQVRESTLR